MTENEAKGWAALAATYEQCVKVASTIWEAQLNQAITLQRTLAEEMRDRTPLWAKATDWPMSPPAMVDRSIPVPLFTPRDRLQFLKEVATTLLIQAGQLHLSVTEPEDVGPMVKPFGKDKGTPLTSMSTEDLESSIAWLRDHPAQLVKHGDFLMAADAEVTARAAKTAEIQTQPLNETPLALVPDDRPLPEAP